MLSEMSRDQWDEWVAFFLVEPWAFDCGEVKTKESAADIQARLAATYGNNR